jgi:hypothetical protein
MANKAKSKAKRNLRTYYRLVWLEFHPDHINGDHSSPYMVKKEVVFTQKKALEWALEDLPKHPDFFRFKKVEEFKDWG